MSDDVKPVIKQEMLDDEPQSASPAILPSVLQLVKQELGTLKTEGDCSISKLVISEPSGVSKFEVIPLCSNQTSDNDHPETPALSEGSHCASLGAEELPVEDVCLNTAPQFICDFCDFISKSKRGLSIHVSSKHKKQCHEQKRTLYVCSVDGCKGQFDRQDSLTKHTRKVHRPPEACHICGKVVKSVKDHIRKVHKKQCHEEKLRQYVCSVDGCKGQFDRQDSLTKHTRQVHRLPEACHICGKVVKSVKDHIRKVHTKLKLHHPKLHHKCEVCDEKFSHRYKLKRHIIRRHTFTRPFPCSRCKYAAYESKELRIHFRRTHESSKIAAKKQFKCDTCGKIFITNSHLKVHTDVVHKGLKRFSCSYCEYKSYSKHGL